MRKNLAYIGVAIAVLYTTGVTTGALFALENFSIVVVLVASATMALLWIVSSSYSDADLQYTRPFSVLIVDDDVDSVVLLQKALKNISENIQINVVKVGMAAVHELTNKKFDLVFMDHEMPDLNGPEVVKLADSEIAKMTDDRKYKVPVITFTANQWKDWESDKLAYVNITGHMSKGKSFLEMHKELSDYIRNPLKKAAEMAA